MCLKGGANGINRTALRLECYGGHPLDELLAAHYQPGNVTLKHALLPAGLHRGAIATVIFVAYLSALCNNPLHTATQYALLTALAAVGRTYLSAGAGFIAERTGWPLFFIISALTALPSLVLLVWLQQRGQFSGLTKPTRIVMDD